MKKNVLDIFVLLNNGVMTFFGCVCLKHLAFTTSFLERPGSDLTRTGLKFHKGYDEDDDDDDDGGWFCKFILKVVTICYMLKWTPDGYCCH